MQCCKYEEQIGGFHLKYNFLYSVLRDVWIPRIEAFVEANLDRFINEGISGLKVVCCKLKTICFKNLLILAWAEVPKMIHEAVLLSLGEAGRTVMPKLARNDYVCSMPCKKA